MALFTDDYIETLEPAQLAFGVPEKHTDYFDMMLDAKGRLGIRVSKTQKVWFLEYEQGGKFLRMTLGQYPKTGLKQARTLAAARLSEIN